MKKIGIITLTGYSNYGNRLQNYATQQILENYGFEVTSIRNYSGGRNSQSVIDIVKGRIRPYRDVIKYDIFPLNRYISFLKFNKNIKESKFICSITNKNIKKLKEYNGFVIGSDQIWNPIYREHFYLDFLLGVDIPAISLSASFGISNLPKESLDFYRKGLNNLKAISVRENEGKKIVESVTKRNAKVLIDPTMMLSKQEWLKVSKPHIKKPKKKYILTYALGGLPEDANKLIQHLNINKDYSIVNLGDKKVKEFYSAGPSEFIDFVSNAEIMITDSFHGIAFSTIFNTPYVIFDRETHKNERSMYSRIETFVKHFDAESRKLENLIFEESFEMDFKKSNLILEELKNDFNVFLKDAVKSFK